MQKYGNLADLVKSFQTSIEFAKSGVDTAENELVKIWRWFTYFFHSPPIQVPRHQQLSPRDAPMPPQSRLREVLAGRRDTGRAEDVQAGGGS